MEPEIRTAVYKAAAKTGIGLTLIAALLGVRIVSIAPKDTTPASASEQLDRLDTEFAAEMAEAEIASEQAETDGHESPLTASDLVETATAFAKDPVAEEGDRLVSCSFQSSSQFMRASDCAMRGGRSIDLAGER